MKWIGTRVDEIRWILMWMDTVSEVACSPNQSMGARSGVSGPLSR